MANAHVLISSQTLGSAAASVTFGSGGTLPQGYRDLRLVIFTGSDANTGPFLRVNGDTSTANYSSVIMRGGSTVTASSSATSNGYAILGANTFNNNVLGLTYTVDFMDYAATDKHKTILVRANYAPTSVEAIANRWASTSAITSFSITPFSGNLIAGSTFYLYGVLG